MLGKKNQCTTISTNREIEFVKYALQKMLSGIAQNEIPNRNSDIQEGKKILGNGEIRINKK